MKKDVKYITKEKYEKLMMEHGYITVEELFDRMNNIVCEECLVFVKFICMYCGSEQTSEDANTFHPKGYTCQNCGELNLPMKFGMMAFFGNKETRESIKRIVKKA